MENLRYQQQTPVVDLKPILKKSKLKSFWILMQGYRMHYIFAVVALAISAVLNTATFLLIGHTIDKILPSGRDSILQELILVGLSFVGLALLQGFFTFMSGKLAAETAEALALRIKNYLYDHLQRLSFRYHDKMQTGELIQRCTSDVDAVRRFFADQAISIGRIISLFIINFIAILFLNPGLAVFSIIIIPIVLFLSLWFFKRVSKAYDAFQEQEAKLSTTLQENLSGVRVVKAFSRQNYEIEKFEEENALKYKLGKRFMLMHTLFWPTLDIITGVQLIAGYFVGALLAIGGEISTGDYVAYVGIVIFIIYPIRGLGRIIVQMSTGLVSLQRVMEIIQEDRFKLEETQAPPKADIEGGIEFDNVSFQYETGMPVLKNISFKVEPGQTIALLGSTGSGKTSMLALIPRFYDFQEGEIKLDGIDLRQYPPFFLRQHIGIVEQEPFLFSKTIRENITYGIPYEVSDEEVERAARAAAIHEVILSFPEGYRTLVGERGVTLSGGQKQRVVLARTLIKNPKILILDDATSSVDTETESEIRDALQTMMKERTTFIIAHRVQSVMFADRILIMDKGRIIESGTHAELMKNEAGIYRRIYDLQAQIEVEVEKEVNSV